MRKLILPLLVLSLIGSILYFTRSSSAAVTSVIAPAGTPLNSLNNYNWVIPTKPAGCLRAGSVPTVAYTLNITTPGSYTFTINPTGFTGRVFVYQNNFDPSQPCQNVMNATDASGFYETDSPLTLTLNASAINKKWIVVFHATTIGASGTFSASVNGPAAVTVVPDVTTELAPVGTPLGPQGYTWQYPNTADCISKSGVVPLAAYEIEVPVEGLYAIRMNTTGFTGRVFAYTQFDPSQPCLGIENTQDPNGQLVTADAITIPIQVFFSATKRTIVFTSTTAAAGTFSASITGPAAVTIPESDLSISSQSQSKSVSSGCVQTLNVFANGPGPHSFQWYEGVSGDLTNSILIPGANSNTYTTPPLVGDKSYWVRVSNSTDEVNSSTIKFKVYPATNTPFRGSLDNLQTWNLKTANCNLNGPTVHYRALHMRIPASGQYRIHLNNASFGQYAITTYSNSFDATQPCTNFNGGVTNTDWVGFLPGGQDTIIVVSAATANQLGSFEGYISSIDSCTLPETIEDALIISGNPLDQAVTPGSNATLNFAFTGGSAGNKTIQWYKGVSGDTSQPIAGPNTTTYTTPGLAQINNEITYYYYWARVDDPDSFTHADTATAVVSVISPPITYADVLTQCDEVYPQVNGPTTYYKIFPFKVSTPGTYTFNVTGNGFTPKTALYNGIFFPQFPNVNYSGSGNTHNLIASANNYFLVITTTNANETGSFNVGVSGPTLVVPSLRPEIRTQPTDQTILRGQTATLSVTTNSPALSYQWYTGSCTNKTAVNGNLISYTTPPLTDYKDYWVKVSYGVMYVNSNIAHIRIKPEAIGDSYTIDEDQQLDTGTPGVLANDKKADSKLLRAEDLTTGNLGGAHLDNDGRFTYNPNNNSSGIDTLTYRVKDGTLTSDPGTISIKIWEINDVPVRTNGSVNAHTFNEDGATNTLHLGGLAYGPGGGPDEATQQLVYKVTVVPPASVGKVLLADDTVVTAGASYTISQIQGMKFSPVGTGGSGTYPFTFTVTDNGTSRAVPDPKTLTQTMQITVNPVADLPSGTSATTNEDTQSTAGLVLSRNSADGDEVNHFRIEAIQSGKLYKNDGVTEIRQGDTITYAEGHAGLKFTPIANKFSPSEPFNIQVRALINGIFDQFSSDEITIPITVNPVADLPSVTNASTFVNLQTTAGLVIGRNAVDGAEIEFFKISSITNGTLFKNDGTTAIANGQFITAAEAGAGLKFTPANDSTSSGSFNVQGATNAGGDGLGPAATATITVSKYTTSTTIVSVSPEPSFLGQSVAVNFTVTNASGAAQPGGNVVVTISGGSETCTGSVQVGTCSLTLNNGGNPRVVTAAYQGNAEFDASTGTKDHIVEACSPNTVVTSNADDGTAGTLRSIVDNACPGSTITFDPAVFNPANGPYTIDLGTFGDIAENLLIDKNLTIVGPGADVLTIRRATGSRTKHFRIFRVALGATATISGLTITDGAAWGGPNPLDSHGGGILNEGTLTLKNVAVTNSQAGRDGLASASGGGIYSSGTLQLFNTTVSDNKAFISDGGGVYLGSGVPATFINSTISGNTAAVSGGGVSVHGTATFYNSTITNNTASTSGGGVHLESGFLSGIANNIIAGNSAPVAPDVQMVSSSVSSAGHNLVGINDGAESAFLPGPNVNGDIVGTSASPVLPLLAPLANNGGPTQTHLLLPASPAVNGGDNSLLPIDVFDVDGNSNTTELLSIDQRGLSRINRDVVDIGATEVNYSISTTAGDQQSATINTPFATQLQVTVTESGAPKSGVPVTFTPPAFGPTASFAESSTVTTDANGVATAPVITAGGIVGTYVVNASINGSIDTPIHLTNTQGTALVSLGNLTQTYDGSPKAVSVVTTPLGLSVNVSYNGSGDVPVNAGSYSVVATINEVNYAGEGTGTLVIQQANQSISFTNPGNKSASDAPFALVASATSNLPVVFEVVSGPASISGNILTITGVGTVVVSASQPGDNNFNAAQSVTQSFSVSKIAAKLSLSNLSQTYDGTAKSPTVTTTPANLQGVNIQYKQNGNPVAAAFNVGSYDVTATLTSDTYEAAPVSGTLVIVKASQSINFPELAPITYRDPPLVIEVTATSHLPISFMTSGSCSVINSTIRTSSAGTCNITANQTGDENYLPADPVQRILTVNRATPQITFSNLNQTYDGTPKPATVTTNPTGLAPVFVTYNGSSTAPVNAGTYAVAVDISLPNYVGTASAQLTISKASSSLNWSNPADISYGTALGVTQLNATSSVPGAVSYSPNAGTVLSVGTHSLTANFTPTDNNNYENSSKSVTITVVKAAQIINFGPLGAKAFGDADFTVHASASSSLQVGLSASGQCTISGNTVHLTSAGSCSITASQEGNENYLAATSVSQSFTISKATPVLTWTNPVAITYGTSLNATQLNATSSVSGGFNYTPANGTILNAGVAQTLKVDFTPTDNGNYNAANKTVMIDVLKATQSINFAPLSSKTFGDQDFNISATASSQLNVSLSATGQCSVAGNTVKLTGAGSCTITATQTGNENYLAAQPVSQTFAIAKASPVISWSNPATITYGTVLSATQLNASSTVAGAFSYEPGLGTMLNAGSAQLLKVTFTPGDAANYNSATKSVQLDVAKAATTVGLTSSASPAEVGQPVTFTATVGSSGGTPAGTVQFVVDGVNFGGPVTLNSSGVATITNASLTTGSHSVTANYSGHINFASSNGALAGGQVISSQVSLISFAAATYSVAEAEGFIRVTVSRSGDTAAVVSVDYAVDDTGAAADCSALNGLASVRCDLTALFGTLDFAANETQKSFDIPINQDSYTEGPETFSVTLSNPTGGASLATSATTVVTITDSVAPAPNAFDDTTNFVRQQYHDFLNREPDAAGLAFWKNNIDKCQDSSQRQPGQSLAQCIELQRVITSAAFFLSIEFKETGGLVRDLYVAALNRPANNNMPGLIEFQRDTQRIQRGVVVGQGNWQQTLADNRLKFVKDFVMRDEFKGLYPTTDTPAQYVDKLYLHAGVTPVSQERADAISEFGSASSAGDAGARGRALLRILSSAEFQSRELNRCFVHMQYLGYLRRNPNEAPDNNFSGFDFWLNKLNQFNGDFLQAEMVKAFLLSGEYRHRFGR